MIITKIEIENFLSYNDLFEFKFEKGPTIIIGQNNTGKSKLFDAFNWVLYDQVFNTKEEKWELTKDVKLGLVNNYAKKYCKVSDVISTSVSLTFMDEKGNKHLLSREYDVKKLSATHWDCPKNSSLYYTIIDSIKSNPTDYFDDEATEKLQSILPKHLSKYFLFQGENISEIMSLGSRTAFNNALRDLSRIEVFELAKEYTNKVLKKIRKEFDERIDSDKQLQQQKLILSQEIDNLKEKYIQSEKELENHNNERGIISEQLNKKVVELNKYAECAQLMSEIENLEKQINLSNDHRVAIVSEQRKSIFDSWMYAGSQTIFYQFTEFYNKNKIEKRIPEPIRQEFVKEMLKDEKCKICGSDAPIGSETYNTIKSYINDRSLDKEVELINQLASAADDILSKMKNIPIEIDEYGEKITGLDNKIKQLRDRIVNKKEELNNVRPKGVTEEELKLKNFDQIQSERLKHENNLERIKERIAISKNKLKETEDTLFRKTREYELVIQKSTNDAERSKVIIAGKINEVTERFYQKFFERLIDDIQKTCNDYFFKMTEKNLALSGTVKVDTESSEIFIVDEEGNRQYNINQANKVSLQISFVAAVLAVSNKFWKEDFPFIADAPISALGGNNKVTAVDTMLDIFNQSIIILKDDAVTHDSKSIKNDLIRNLIKEKDSIKKAYELIMDGETIEEQHTIIKELK